MTMPPPTLEDIGEILWGHGWEFEMAIALGVHIDVLRGWVEDPTTIPQELEVQLSKIADARTEEIELGQAMMFARGINRKFPKVLRQKRGNDED